MLSDGPRVHAYNEAIRRQVQAHDRVVDIGTGSGLLAMLAAKAGADTVDAIEIAEIIELARELIQRNNLASRIRLHKTLSFHAHLPKRAHVLVTETLGNFGLEEGILGVVTDARARLLEPEARIIPERIRLYAAPVELPNEYKKIEVWKTGLFDIDLSFIAPTAANLLWYTRIEASELLGPFAALGQVDLYKHSKDSFQGSTQCAIERSGILHGIAGTFEADLCAGIQLGNHPTDGAPSWRQAFLPASRPLPVEAGDQIEVEIKTWNNGEHWAWRITRNNEQLDHSTIDGYRSPLAL